jgi:chorismate mutase/prephenate dehydratase
MTMFLAIGGTGKVLPRANKSILSAHLPNTPGSLCNFLDTFRKENVNLSKIISRPIRGCPREYAFLVEITGNPANTSFKRALTEAEKTAVSLKLIGSFPCHKTYKS